MQFKGGKSDVMGTVRRIALKIHNTMESIAISMMLTLPTHELRAAQGQAHRGGGEMGAPCLPPICRSPGCRVIPK